MENCISHTLTVSIVGAPNVGKSTFLNTFLNHKVSIVSPKPNTTRGAIVGIYNHMNYQIIFTDTPGIGTHNTQDDLSLRKIARQNIYDKELVAFVFDATKPLPEHILYHARIAKHKIAIVNKIDLVKKSRLLPIMTELMVIFDKIFLISARQDDGIEDLRKYLLTQCQPGELLYDQNQYSLTTHDKLIQELAREVIMNMFEHEIPYKTQVTNSKIHQEDDILYVEQNIWIRATQKHIFLGKIKELSMKIRQNISQALRIRVQNLIKIKY